VTKPPLNPITLTKGDIGEIRDEVHDTTAKQLQQFEQEYLQSLGTIHNDLHKLQIQTNKIQVATRHVSAAQTSLTPGTSQGLMMVRSVDLRVVMLPEGSLSVEPANDKVIVSTLKNISLKLVAFPNEYLHTLQTCVTTELRAQLQHTLSLVIQYWVNNEQMFAEKMEALKAKEMIQA